MVYLDKLSNKKDIEEEINIYSSWLPCGGKARLAFIFMHKMKKT